ncbi:hypothetical protein [Rubrivirga sp. IMCC45206]|uniref:hypothetical protein n=1 Tax=Rubrivirga sp. IMCC45206 TaxID=3391614 RepID=UPI00398FA1DA
MNDYQRAKLDSYRATVSALDRYPAEVAAVAALQRSVDWIRARVGELEAAAEQQAAYVARGEAKDEVLEALAEATVPVAQALAAKADEAGDSVAADLYDFEHTDITHSTDQDAIDRAGIVLKGAQAEDPVELADYGATTDDVAALAAAYADFREALTEPRDAIVERRVHTEAVERLVPEIGAHLRRRTDRLMTRYRKTAFGTEYKTARTIIDP